MQMQSAKLISIVNIVQKAATMLSKQQSMTSRSDLHETRLQCDFRWQ